MFSSFELLEDRCLLADGDGIVAAIVGGSVSDKGQWPWMISLQAPGFGHFCGGSLIAPDVVLTAAHCVEGQSIRDLSAIVGRQDLNSFDGQQVDVAEIHIHPDYEAFTNGFDAALLILGETASAIPVSYLRQDQSQLAAPGVTATVIGWGTTREGGRGSTQLRQVSVPIVANDVANEPHAYAGLVSDQMLAAGYAEGGEDSCQGDSGGPLLVFNRQDEPVVAGIVSWGEGCARPDKYGIYARVSEMATWIDQFVAPDSRGVVAFAQDRYLAHGFVEIRLRDGDLRTADSVEVAVTSDSGDLEFVRMTSIGDGRFIAAIAINTDRVAVGDGALNVMAEEQIHITYQDQNDGSGQAVTVTDAARIIEDDFGNGPADAAVLGSSASMRGEIELSGDADWFRFEARLGRAYLVSVLLNGSLDDSVLTVYAADGQMVLGFDNDSGRGLGSELIFVPATVGASFIAVSAANAGVGTYELQLREIDPPSDDHTNGAASATWAAAPASLRGRIESATDVDWFTFEAIAGANYQIDVRPRTLNDSVLRLFDADGHTELAFNDDVSRFDTSSTIYWSADTSGRRYFEVAGYQGDTGTYDVSLTAVADDHANQAVDATRLQVSTEPVRASGEITPLDVDWFRFTATADRFYEVTTTLNTLADSVLSVVDGDGVTRLVRNDDRLGSRASRLLWQADWGGDFFVEVAGFDLTAGSYQLDIREVDPPRDDIGNRAGLASPLAVPGVVGGIINYEADLDWLEFEAFAGQRFTIETELRSLADSVLRLFDSDGATLLVENDDIGLSDVASRIVWTASSHGTRFVEVSGFDGDTGTFRLSIDREFAEGDLNRDNLVNAADIDLLFAAARDAEPSMQFDLNGDASVDSADVDYLLGRLGTVRGDSDLNGRVEFADFLALAGALGTAGGWGVGDFDGDGIVQFTDFLALADQFGFDQTTRSS